MFNFIDAIKLGFQNYFKFKGRSTRSEYWWWVLFIVLAGIPLTLIDRGLSPYDYDNQNGVLSGLFELATLIPSLSLGVRRLHDINKSGWWLLMWLSSLLIIPIILLVVMGIWLWFILLLIIPMTVPMIILLVWAAKRGETNTNKYGPDPQQDVPSQTLTLNTSPGIEGTSEFDE